MDIDKLKENKDVQKIEADSFDLMKRIKGRSVKTHDDMLEASTDLRIIKTMEKHVSEVRKGITRPLDESKRRIMDHFRPFLERLKAAETLCKDEIEAYQANERRKESERLRREEEKRKKEAKRLEKQAAEAREAGRDDRADILMDRATEKERSPLTRDSVKPQPKGVHTRTVYKFEVTNPDVVPDVYKMVDEAAIRKVVNALKGKIDIPGVRIWSEESVSARSL